MVRGTRGGFTLLELMVVVTMLSVLAAIAIPAYTSYMRRSKASEVTLNLNGMFKAVSSYYTLELSTKGASGTAAGRCIVDDTTPTPLDPSSSKQPFIGDANFRAIGYLVPDLVYYSYGIYSARGTLTGDCSTVPVNTPVYTLYGHGDLDNDNVLSTYEMSVAVDSSYQMYHAPGFFSDQPDE